MPWLKPYCSASPVLDGLLALTPSLWSAIVWLQADESEDTWKRNAETILSAVPDVAFGIYECPFPYKRLMSPELLRWCADTGRFLFLKDTCCDVAQMQLKLEALQGSPLKLFNANATTLLDSLRLGAAGFSGVMANFHPDLYVRLLELASTDPAAADRLQNYLGLASAIERQLYPVNAKYHMQLEGPTLELAGRSMDDRAFTPAMRKEIEQLRAVAAVFRGM